MAKLTVDDGQVVFGMNWLEKLAVASFREPGVPVGAVHLVDVVDRPAEFLRKRVSFGLGTAPWPWLFTSVRAQDMHGRAAVLVYWRRRSVRVEFGQSTAPWRLFLASCPDPGAVATELRQELAAAGIEMD